MAETNRISESISPEVKQQILTKLQEIKTLVPFLRSLTPKDRREIPTMGTARSAMDQTFASQMTAHPTLVPSYIDLEELGRDRDLFAALNDLAAASQELTDLFNDTGHLAGADIFSAYSSFHTFVQDAAHRNVSTAGTVLATIQPFMPQGRRGRAATPPPAPPA